MTIEKLNLKTGEYETHLNRAGKGEAILFIHGSGPGATAFSNWQHALPEFGQNYLALAPDLIGFGESSHPDPAPNGMRPWMRLWIDQLIHLLDALNIERAHLVGNSLGGSIALHLLMEAPERFDKVVLMGPAGAPFQLSVELDRIWGFYEDPTEAPMRNAIRWFAYNEEFILDRLNDITQMRLKAALRTEVRRSYEAMFPAPRQRHVDELVVPESALKKIDHPVLIVHGRDDKIVPYTTSLYFLEHLSNVRLYLLGQCSHWIQIEHKDTFHRLLWDFFGGAI
ncbi:MAG: 2-hydroxymuconic semialdehyde hydrolase [Candidatus Carbobacillus altaicus]|uniref:2-hydroxymuconic semialdehyde hydrolase n=1 Tax=Candidatus Carbonibacillus altaicus TaxID=2163959 RepID=A0A2R6XY15_9BACL|nr:MAG: 2-hydroxymuconic semialdehyde hydrolase [Candidatus Carbobacillus altaicus]